MDSFSSDSRGKHLVQRSVDCMCLLVYLLEISAYTSHHRLLTPVSEMIHSSPCWSLLSFGKGAPSTMVAKSSGGKQISPTNFRRKEEQAANDSPLDGRSEELLFDATLSIHG